MDSLPAASFVSANPRHPSASGQLSPFVLFLDIDGVLYNQAGQPETQKLIHAKISELFPNATHPYRRDILGLASVYFFNEMAVTNLTNFINAIKKTRDVQIVMSSSWREKRSVEELQQLFSMHEFSKYIVSKTPDQLSKEEFDCCSVCKQMNNTIFCRAAEIQFWLNQHPQITSYAIIDDEPAHGHLPKVFKEKYYETRFSYLLTEEICREMLINNHIISVSPPSNQPQPPTQTFVRSLDPSNSHPNSSPMEKLLKIKHSGNGKTPLENCHSFLESEELLADFRKPLESPPISPIGLSEEEGFFDSPLPIR